MLENIEEVKKAKEKIVEGSLTIWNARLDALIRAGDVRGVLVHMTSPVEWGDNCDCQGNCNCAEPGMLIDQPLKRPATKAKQ